MLATVLSLIAIVVSLLAAWFALNQALLLKKQIQLQAIIDFDREWRSQEMRSKRSSLWTDGGHPDENKVEDILEFLEKVSSFEQRGIIQYHLLWDTLGWYIVRYHHHCRNAIEILRDKWTHKRDPTLYQDLEELSAKLTREEASQRGISEDEVRRELDDEDLRKRFIESERALIHE
jgi:hypothetical protein